VKTIGVGRKVARRATVTNSYELFDYLLAYLRARNDVFVTFGKRLETLGEARAYRSRQASYAKRHQKILEHRRAQPPRDRTKKSAQIALQHAIAQAQVLRVSTPFTRALPEWTPEMRTKAREDWAKGREAIRIKALQDQNAQRRAGVAADAKPTKSEKQGKRRAAP
jgi:hypothetical protein